MNALLTAMTLNEAMPSTSAGGAGWHAALDLVFERRGGRTVMVRNRHVGPLRVQKPLYPEGATVCHAIVLHPPAGIVGGDSLAIDVAVGAGAHVLLTTPGAGKWYRSAGRVAKAALTCAHFLCTMIQHLLKS